MCSWATEEPIKRVHLSSFFLEEHRDGSFACHLAVKGANKEVSHNSLGLSEEAQRQGDDRISAIYLALYKRELSVWQTAQKYRRVMMLQKLLDWRKNCK